MWYVIIFVAWCIYLLLIYRIPLRQKENKSKSESEIKE